MYNHNATISTTRKMEDFSATIRAIFRSADKAGEGGFYSWYQRAKETREALLYNRDKNNAEIEAMRNTWAQPVIDEKRKFYQDEENRLHEIARKEILADLERLLSLKQQKYTEAMGAPTDEQLRLLTALQMRVDTGESLTSSDFANVVNLLNNNFHCLKQLGNLAAKSGVPFPMIHDDFINNCENVRKAADNLLNSLEKPDKDLEYREKLFWDTGSAGVFQPAFDELENLSYLTVTATEIKQAGIEYAIKKAAQKESASSNKDSKFCSKVKLNGMEDVSALADQFHVTVADIKELNPGFDFNNIRYAAGREIYIPSTRYSFEPNNPSRAQDSQVTIAEKPTFTIPVGPGGEKPGEDINLVPSDSAFD